MITDKGKKKLLAFHGLDPEKHTDDDVDDAIKNAVTPDDLEDMQNRAKAGDDALAALADADLVKYANRIGTDKDVVASWKEDLLKNRASTIKKLEAIPAPVAVVVEQKKPIHNRANAGNPAVIDHSDPAAVLIATKKNTMIKNRAEKLQEGGMPMSSAHIQANKEIEGEFAAGMHK